MMDDLELRIYRGHGEELRARAEDGALELEVWSADPEAEWHPTECRIRLGSKELQLLRPLIRAAEEERRREEAHRDLETGGATRVEGLPDEDGGMPHKKAEGAVKRPAKGFRGGSFPPR